MKRLLTALLALTFLLSLCVSAASTTTQSVEILKEDGNVTVVTTQPATFWETPTLKAGETITVPGMLTIVNKTDTARDVTLETVLLPYNNQAALEYLNHLTVTVATEDEVLYSGPYSRINDGDNLSKIQAFLSPNEAVVFTVWLSCDYTYTGSTYVNNSVLEWQFTTPLTEEELAVQAETEEHDPIVNQWLLGGGISIVLIVVLLLISRKKTS